MFKKLHLRLLLLFLFTSLIVLPTYSEIVKIATWNIHRFSENTAPIREDDFRKVIEQLDLDILIVQEIYETGVNIFLENIMNYSSPGTYKKAEFEQGFDTGNALFYKDSVIACNHHYEIDVPEYDLEGEKYNFREISEYELEIKEGPNKGTKFRIYSVHLRSGKTNDIKKLRAHETQTLRSYLNNYLDNHQSNNLFLVCGDFNMQSSEETAFENLTGNQADNDGKVNDPIEKSGKWNEVEEFAKIHTQATRTIKGNVNYGGLDDRFDMILFSSEFNTSKILRYKEESYGAYGNDGNHFNMAINDPPAIDPGSEIAEALWEASDHLPVIIELETLTGDLPVISLSTSKLNFGSTTNYIITPDQQFRIVNNGGGTLNWKVTEDSYWLRCDPLTGVNAGIVTVSVDPHLRAPDSWTETGTITVTDSKASNSPQAIDVIFTMKYPIDCESPFGSYDTPIDGTSGITGAIPVTGWVLDEIGVDSIKVYRSLVAGEDAEDLIYKDLIYIGEAVFVEGARADVEQAYPDYPLNYQAGWGYMMLTNFLPGQGNGTYKIHAYATDLDGHSISLGMKTITCDNANAVKPFGAIDTPTQGGTVTGPFFNSGWALTPMPNNIPIDGSTINVWVDGVRLGNPDYNQYRNDIAALFPGYENTDGAVGAYLLDTTTYDNGVHTIAWSVKDNAGNSDGIGSRFFTISNTGGSAQAEIQSHKEVLRPSISYESILNMAVNFDPIKHKRGYRENIKQRKANPDEYGIATIEIREVERVELELGKGVSTGYLVVGDQLRPLPIGSTLNIGEGIFSWQSGPGFIGEYELVFIKTDEFGMQRKIQMKVKIRPKFGTYSIDFFKNSKAKGKMAGLK